MSVGPGGLYDTGSTWDGGIVWDGTTAIQFVDETGCPLVAGISVSIYGVNGQGYQQALVGQAFTRAGGYCNITLPIGSYPEFIAFFVGNEAPQYPQIFASGASTITVYKHRSPSKTQLEYANEGSALQPLGWYSLTAQQQGGVLHSVMRGILAGIAADDASAEVIHEMLRLQSCTGGEIDSWSRDMVGSLFQRFVLTNDQGGTFLESDSLYLARLLLMIGRPRCSITSLQNICRAFYASIQGEVYGPNANNLAYGVAGGYNEAGAFNTAAPGGGGPPSPSNVYVWDSMTQPGLATQFGIAPPQFVIQVGSLQVSKAQLLAYDVYGGFDVSGAFNIFPTGDQPTSKPTPVPPDFRLGVIISFIAKAAGTLPMYLIGNVQ